MRLVAPKRFYLFFTVALFAGFAWLAFAVAQPTTEMAVESCVFKHATDLPCPSCGSTRSVISVLHGNIKQAIYFNPIGLIVFLIMAVGPLWLLFDLVSQKNSLFVFYRKAESIIKKKWVAVPAIVFVLLNWIWNIYKNT